jgi:hypothetical protein
MWDDKNDFWRKIIKNKRNPILAENFGRMIKMTLFLYNVVL